MRRLACFVLLLATLSGCKKNNPQLRGATPPVPTADGPWTPLPDQPTLEVQRDAARAVFVRESGGATVPFTRGGAAVGDKLVLEISPGQIVVVRQPSAIAKDSSKLSYVYLRDGDEALVTTEGFQGEPYVDRQSRVLCWSARTCTNPACASRNLATAEHPFLFTVRIADFTINEKGEAVYIGSNVVWPHPACAHCGQVSTVKHWAPAEAASRAEELAQELSRSRQLRDQAEQAAAAR
jgi:hypothetical protein